MYWKTVLKRKLPMGFNCSGKYITERQANAYGCFVKYVLVADL